MALLHFYISEILVASVNQKMFNNLSDRGRGTKKKIIYQLC